MALTIIAIANAKPKDKPYVLNDGRGLNLEISPKGGKWWRLRYTFGGKPNRISLGTFPEISLTQARERREDARKLIAQGVDPATVRKDEKLAQAGNGFTFESVARDWFQKQKGKWTDTYAANLFRILELNAFPWLGERPIKDIDAPELLRVLRRIEERGALEVAKRVRQNAGAIFRYGIATGAGCVHDVAADLSGALEAPKSTHRAAITDSKEVGALLRAIDGYKGAHATRCALRLAPLLFVRPGELRRMEWAEIDFEAARWVVPSIKMKMKQEHIVPLSKQALAVLRELHPLTGPAGYVFPSERGASRPMSPATINAALRRMGYPHEAMSAHGFRAMASTLLNEKGWDSDYIERQLAHAEGNKVRAAYNRSKYLSERTNMMQDWADYLDALREGGKVVPIFKATAGE